MKAEKDPERYALLDAEQLAYKLTGNSLYGQLGSGTFKIRLQALAASVTAYGRKQILYAKAAIEKFYGPEAKKKHCCANVMYGDTDSLFVEFNPRNPETGERLTGREARVATIDVTDEAGALITKTLAAPHDFEFDKAFDPLLMFSKKRYAGNMYEENPDDYVHKYMGIALKRRDNAPIVKTIFGGAMKMLLDKRDVVGAFQFVKEKCLELVDGKVNLGQLTVTKSLRADYADPARIAHKALADRITQRDPGNAPAAGDRIGYVYISAKAGQEASKLQGERIETPQFIKDHQLVPDYRHYIEHQLQNPISQAFGLLLEQIPGFQKDMIRSCPAVTEDLDKYLAFREAKAAELLFSDCLKRFEKASTRQAITGMFKGSIVISKAAITSTTSKTSAVSTTKPTTRSTTSITKQTTMSSFLLDSMIVDGIKKKNQAKAAAATRAANKKAKEESAKEEST
jgi:DNA polymerase elongation subunit (family B)